MTAETFELSPDGRRIEYLGSLEAAVERVAVLLSSRVDVQEFRIYASAAFGRPLVDTVSRDRGYRPH